MTVTKTTIKRLYPHLLKDKEFCDELVGLRVKCYGTVTLEFDENSAQCNSLSYDMNFSRGWVEALGSIERAMKVLNTNSLGDQGTVLKTRERKLESVACK